MPTSLIFRLTVQCAFKKPSSTLVLAQYPRSPSTPRVPLPRLFSTMDNTAAGTPRQVEYQGTEYNVIKEGLAHILNPPSQEAASKGPKRHLKEDDQAQSVFYNPIQQFNRDLSVLAIRAYGEHAMDLRKKKTDQKMKKRAGNGEKKRKREDDENENEQVPRPAPKEGEQEGKAEENEQPVSAPIDQQADANPEKQHPPPSFTVLDALSATGLRALRYASELPFVTKVVGNDMSESAIKSMNTNIAYNKLEDRIQPNLGDARAFMYGLDHADKFDVIDLDPYGTAGPFLDGAVQAAKDGGLLCVTCTDAGVWASTGYSEKAFALYGGIPVKGQHSHEGGLRLILNSLAMSASKYGISIEPLLSLSIDFYARVFVRVYRSPAQVKFNAGNTMLVWNCDAGCGAWSTQPIASTRERSDKKGNPFYHHGITKGPTSSPTCEHCGTKTHLAGPMWAGPLHNPIFIQKILDMLPGADKQTYQTTARIEGMLTTALEEDLDLTPSKSSAETSTPKPETETEINIKTSDSDKTSYPALIPRQPLTPKPMHPFYFSLSALSKVLHTTTPPIDEFRGAIAHLGYRSTRSHTKPNSIRTDAPWAVVWEIMREWVRQHAPNKSPSLKPGTAGAGIMAKSRENLRVSAGGDGQGEGVGDQSLSTLKTELLAAIQGGRDVGDLVTKVEAALYRSGARGGNASAGKGNEGVSSGDASAPAQAATSTSTSSSTPPHPSTLQVTFDAELGRQVSEQHTSKRLVRYQLNPREHWGPLNRAGRS